MSTSTVGSNTGSPITPASARCTTAPGSTVKSPDTADDELKVDEVVLRWAVWPGVTSESISDSTTAPCLLTV